MKVICENFKDGKRSLEIEPTSECNSCDKPPHTCVLLCDCEDETCNIGQREE